MNEAISIAEAYSSRFMRWFAVEVEVLRVVHNILRDNDEGSSKLNLL